jgi:uncharacterized linocin/CFP29 family protein
MASNDPQVPWSDEQWARVSQTVQKEAARSRVAASFLPLVGPLPPDTDFVKGGQLTYIDNTSTPPPRQIMHVDDRKPIQLATLQVRVQLRGAQVADPNLTSALEMFRRAANILARLEDTIVFRGQTAANQGPPAPTIQQLPAIWGISGGEKSDGLYDWASVRVRKRAPITPSGQQLVVEVSRQIGALEARGHFGPFAVVLGEGLFSVAQDPNINMVLPSDRIIPFLGGGPLLRSSTLPNFEGFVIALGASPFELVIATDVSVGFLQVTTEPAFVFRVYEKVALRAKEPNAIVLLTFGGAGSGATGSTGGTGATGGASTSETGDGDATDD